MRGTSESFSDWTADVIQYDLLGLQVTFVPVCCPPFALGGELL